MITAKYPRMYAVRIYGFDGLFMLNKKISDILFYCHNVTFTCVKVIFFYSEMLRSGIFFRLRERKFNSKIQIF